MPAFSTRPDLETLAARALRDWVAGAPVGGLLPADPYPELLQVLEFLVPALLIAEHPEWTNEAIDGIRVAQAARTGAATCEFVGAAILLGDQCLTPLVLRLTAGDGDELSAVRVRIGERGGGSLGISGPACTAPAADTLLAALPWRQGNVAWVYDIVLGDFERRRPLFPHEREVLRSVIEHAALPGVADLLPQLDGLTVELGGMPSWLDFAVAPGARPVGVPDGPLPEPATVVDEAGEAVGEILVWLDGGLLSAIEHVWFTDDAPLAFPSPARLRFG